MPRGTLAKPKHAEVDRDHAEHHGEVVARPGRPPALEAEAEQVGEVPAGDDDERVDQQRQRLAVRAQPRQRSARAGASSRSAWRSPLTAPASRPAPQGAQRARRSRAGRPPASRCRHSRPPGAACAGRTTSTYSRSGSAARASSALSSRNCERRRIGDARAHASAPCRAAPADTARRSAAPPGRGPTRLMSPRSTSISCGSSSSLVRRRQRAGARDARIGADGERRPAASAATPHGAELVDAKRHAAAARPAPGGRTPGPGESSLIHSATTQRTAAPAAPARARPRRRSNTRLAHRERARSAPARPARASTTRSTSASVMRV